MIFSGLAMSPAMDANWPLIVDLFGGRQSARSVHFNFMARGEPLANSVLLDQADGLLGDLAGRAVALDLRPRYLVSTILPRDFGDRGSSPPHERIQQQPCRRTDGPRGPGKVAAIANRGDEDGETSHALTTRVCARRS